MRTRSLHRYLGLLVLAGWAAEAEEPAGHPAVEEVAAPRPYLRYERPLYRNFVYDPFTQYPDHTWSLRTVGSQQGGRRRPRPRPPAGPLRPDGE